MDSTNPSTPAWQLVEQRVRALLERDGAFVWVRHAKQFVAHDESVPVPHVLTFDYNDAQFFARCVGGTPRLLGGVYLETPPNNREIGYVEVVGLSDEDILSPIKACLDRHITPVITLTRDGDQVAFKADTPEEESIVHSVGHSHRYCGGCLDRHIISETNTAISCRKCHLRVVVPKPVQTVADLRRWAEHLG